MTDTPKAMTVVERGDVEKMSPVVAATVAILRENPSPEAFEKMYAVQERWEAGEARKAYAAAMVSLKSDLPTVIGRDTAVDFTGKTGIRTFYRHTSLAAVMDAITDPLTRHGFSLGWTPSTGERGVTVTCRLTHSAGHFEETTINAPIDSSGNKSQAQGVASTITLLSRYTALALLGIATADMKEPAGEPAAPDPDKIDTARNMRMVAALKSHGRTREAAEQLVGRKVADWTTTDIERLTAWAVPKEEPVAPLTTPGASQKAAATLAEVLATIEAARTKNELKTVAQYALELPEADRPQARDAYVAKMKTLGGAA